MQRKKVCPEKWNLGRLCKGVGAHLIVVQRRIIAEGTDGCELHESIKLPTAHRLLPLPPAESERSAQGRHWPRPQGNHS